MSRLGILGGGQLGRMTLQAASRLGIDVVIGERFSGSPAARMTDASVVFEHGWHDPAALEAFAGQVDVVTLENEFVDARVLSTLEARGVRVWPDATCVATVQDKLLQKQALARAELPVPRFAPVEAPRDLQAIGEQLGWPLMLKARRDGYDGRGNVLVDDPTHAEAACQRLGWPERRLFAEAFAPFERELAGLVVRRRDGHCVEYPIVETRQDARLHICREVLAPADVPPAVAGGAARIARAAVEAVGGVGAFGVEMFLLPGGEVLINELAPRPHNSAHYSIEACATSQFENHVRAVMGLPLGEPRLLAPAAVMVNVLGSSSTPPSMEGLAAALEVQGAHVHLYGKAENRPGRKMVHVTAVADRREVALERARAAAAAFGL
jgi:5-(carboxyamino)imidazole ribonucleotide synthase